MIAVRQVSTLEELESIREAWNKLLASGGPGCIFLTHEWMSAWWKSFGAGKRLFVLVLSEGREVTGIVPWAVQRVWGGRLPARKLHFLGSGLSDRLDVLIPRNRKEHLARVMECLRENPGTWDVLDLRELPGDSESAALFADLAREGGLMTRTRAGPISPFLRIESDWDSFYRGRFDGRSRGQIRRLGVRLNAQSELTTRVVRDLRREPDLLARIAAMPQSRNYRGKRRRGLLAGDDKRRFFEDVLARFSERGWMSLALLELAGRPIAYRFEFEYEGRHYDYFPGFDPAYAAFSPGRILLIHRVQEAFERGMKEFDFLRGDEAYKLRWTDTYRTSVRLMLFAPTLAGRALQIAYRVRDRWAGTARVPGGNRPAEPARADSRRQDAAGGHRDH